MPKGCTDAQVLAPANPDGGVAPCEALTSGEPGVQVGSLSVLASKISLSAAQRATLEHGGVLTTDPRFVRSGHISYVAGAGTHDGPGAMTGRSVTQRTRLPAVTVNPQLMIGKSRGEPLFWVLPATAASLGWPVRIDALQVTSPTGAISPEEERAVADRLGQGYVFYVERGYQNKSWLILLILFSVAGLLVLVASLISTALSLAESQDDMATLAAVGATRRTRRGVAASQALVVAASGCLLGVVVGLIPGIAFTWPLTVRYVSVAGSLVQGTPAVAPLHQVGPVIVVPWLPLLGLVLLVPLLAAGLAWLAVRRHPQMTRRLA